ncbi:hypothetical protein K458DRAFT_7429 [Lentithecium fluviatile CBS 122367]|uniref:Mid2 domain-containing protein n=1 Tax=Lentithecium fluviatile CBS 122367 TaxID=1168545 RepID=A0A6G1JMY5_9PLEO|nr:hypothetical protein K458DRAFT_7429 [Lentithecium fluviatile CBS 122367]
MRDALSFRREFLQLLPLQNTHSTSFYNTMAPLVPLMVLLASITLAASNPVSRTTTPDPTITAPPRRVFRRSLSTSAFWTGYYTDTYDGEAYWTSWTLGGESALVYTDSFVFLCDTSASDWETSCSQSFATSCDGSTALFLDGSSSACEVSCNADTIFTSNTVDTDALHWYGCAGRNARFYFEVQPTDTTSPTPTPTDTTSPSPSPADSTTPTPSPTSSPTDSPTPNDADSTTNRKSSASKAWVAGPVIGGVAAIGIGGLIFFLLRRRKQNAPVPAYQAAPQMQSPQPYQSPSMAHNAVSPNVPPYMDPAVGGYYSHQVVENKPDNLSVYSHTMPMGQAYAPSEGTMRMPTGVSEYHGGEGQAPAGGTAHMGQPLNELPSDSPTHDLPELSNTTQAR